MKTDRELLELAAKVAGIEVIWLESSVYGPTMGRVEVRDGEEELTEPWNPLTDDGDALRLAVTLRMRVEVNEASIVVTWNWNEVETADSIFVYPDQGFDEDFNVTYSQHDAATRRAIVRAAAEIGRSIP